MHHQRSSSPPTPAPARKHRKTTNLPSSFLSSFRIQEALVEDLQLLPAQLIAGLSRWIVCFIVVQFDVDIGPDLKIIRPAIKFSEDEFRTICFSSLPERTSSCMELGSTSAMVTQEFHTFRFVHTDGSILHANCLFSQCKDPSRMRGYIQESLVIISTHNLPFLFHSCLKQIMTHNMFLDCSLDHKVPILDAAINNISQWPDPEFDCAIELGFLGSVLRMILPPPVLVNPLTSQNLVESWSHSFISLFHDLSDLYMLYECVILGRPMIVYGSTPNLCSTFIHTILDLIRPVPYGRSILEYVTIHSCPTDFGHGITGLTNPFLLNGIDQVAPFVFILSNHKVQTASSFHDSSQLEEENRIKAIVRSTNKAITRARLLAPDAKFLSSLTSPSNNIRIPDRIDTGPYEVQSFDQDDLAMDHAIRFHFATLTSKLLSPVAAWTGKYRAFNVRQFTREMAAEDWTNNNSRLFTTPNQSMLHRISSRTSLFAGPSNKGILTGKQLFYKEFVKSSNFALWLESNGIDRV
jgi:hypothetical protein